MRQPPHHAARSVCDTGAAVRLLREAAAVVFDLEGVVLDTEPVWDDVHTELLARRGLPWDRETLKPLMTGRAALDAVTVLIDRLALPDTPAGLVRERNELMLRHLHTGVPIMAGFKALHADLTARGRPTAFATAMDPALFAAADQAADLTPLVCGRVSLLGPAGQPPVRRGKPWPDLFLHAAALLGVGPSACVVVEDAPNGIRAAAAAGMRCIAVATTHPAASLTGATAVAPDVVSLASALADQDSTL